MSGNHINSRSLPPPSTSREVSGVHDAKYYGAIGDGVSRPLSTKFNVLSAAKAKYPFVTALTQELDWAGIQLAINEADEYGGNVFIPDGKYMINDTLSMPNNTVGTRAVNNGNLTIEGAGSSRTILVAMDGVTRLIEAVSPDYVQTQARFDLKDLQLNGVGTTAQIGIYVKAAKEVHCVNVRFQGFKNEQFYFDQAFDFSFTDCFFYNATNTDTTSALLFMDYGDTDNVNEIHFTNCRWEGYARPAIRMTSGPLGTNKINEIMFSQCKWESIYVVNHIEMFGALHVLFSDYNFAMARSNSATPTYGILANNSKYLQFVNGACEWFVTGANEYPWLGMTNGCQNVSVISAYFNGSMAHTPIMDIDKGLGTAAKNVTIIGAYGTANADDLVSNIDFINYINKSVMVTAKNVTPIVGLQRTGTISKTYLTQVDSTGSWRVDDGASTVLKVDPTTHQLALFGGVAARYVAVPASATATGQAGDFSADSGFIYICHAANTWKRVAIATW